MKKYKYILLLIIFIIYFCILYFIDFKVNDLDLRFYTSKDNGLFSYFEITLLTILLLYIILFRKILIAIIFGSFCGIFSFISLYLLINWEGYFGLSILCLIISMFPIIIYTVLKKNILSVKFKYFDLFYFIVYMILLEIILKNSMNSNVNEIFWYWVK